MRGWVERAAEGDYVTYEAVHGRPDGDGFTVSGSIRPVLADGEGRSLIASAHGVGGRADE